MSHKMKRLFDALRGRNTASPKASMPSTGLLGLPGNTPKTTALAANATQSNATVYPTVWNYAPPKPRKLRDDLRENYLKALASFDVIQLRRRITMPITEYPKEFENRARLETTNGLNEYLFIDNQADILCVAHLDCVYEEHKTTRMQEKDLGDVIYAIEVDDRVGAYIILDLLPKLGVKADILLTEGEESGMSSAAGFVAPEGKKYKWLFEFDRRGDDVVMYQYDTIELGRMLKGYDFEVVMGTFSDISYLDDLGVAGFNFGCGYYDEHTRSARVAPEVMLRQVARFMSFYEANKDTRFEHVKETRSRYSSRSLWHDEYGNDGVSYGGYSRSATSRVTTSSYDSWGWQLDEMFVCPTCGGEVRKTYGKQSVSICHGCNTDYYKIKIGSEVFIWDKARYVPVGNTVFAKPSTKCCKCREDRVYSSWRWVDSEAMSFVACPKCSGLHAVVFTGTGNYMLEAPGHYEICTGCGGGVINSLDNLSTCPVCHGVFVQGKQRGYVEPIGMCDLCGDERQDDTHFLDTGMGEEFLGHSCYRDLTTVCISCGQDVLDGAICQYCFEKGELEDDC